MVTVGARLEAVNSRPSGFDYVRLTLSVSVVAFHSVVTSYGSVAGDAMWGTSLGIFARMILPMFFALSGFWWRGA